MRSRQKLPPDWVRFENRNSQKQLMDSKNNAEARSFELENTKIENKGINSIERSGNSDVDIQIDVHVDTTPIAFAILCSLLATKQMNNLEFEEAVSRLQNLNFNENFSYSLNSPNDPSTAKIYKRNRRKVD